MAARPPIAADPIRVIHAGTRKSKRDSETSTEPTASATWTVTADPLPNSTWANTAAGTANKIQMAPQKPRDDLMLDPPYLSAYAAVSGKSVRRRPTVTEVFALSRCRPSGWLRSGWVYVGPASCAPAPGCVVRLRLVHAVSEHAAHQHRPHHTARDS